MISSLIKFLIEIFRSVVVSYFRDGVRWLVEKVKKKPVEVITSGENELTPIPVQSRLVPVTDFVSLKTTEESFSLNLGFFKWFKKKTEHIFRRNNK